MPEEEKLLGIKKLREKKKTLPMSQNSEIINHNFDFINKNWIIIE